MKRYESFNAGIEEWDTGEYVLYADVEPLLNRVKELEAQLAAAPVAAPQDADPNAPWLSLAHMICADAGIPPGHITARLEVLRGKLEATVAAQEPIMLVPSATTPGTWKDERGRSYQLTECKAVTGMWQCAAQPAPAQGEPQGAAK